MQRIRFDYFMIIRYIVITSCQLFHGYLHNVGTVRRWLH